MNNKEDSLTEGVHRVVKSGVGLQLTSKVTGIQIGLILLKLHNSEVRYENYQVGKQRQFDPDFQLEPKTKRFVDKRSHGYTGGDVNGSDTR